MVLRKDCRETRLSLVSDNSSKLKVPSDGPEKRFWLFDFDGVAVNLQIPLVHTACNAI